MASNLRLSSLIPAGLIVESTAEDHEVIVISARSAVDCRACPLCGRVSGRIHSRYPRTIADLPCSGRRVQIQLKARRIVCETPFCRRQIFTERFDEEGVTERSRRTSRLECIVHLLGLALGGRPAAGFARRLMVLVSNDTLLRVVRRRSHTPTEPLSVVGIDDWAFRRNHRYGTIVYDLERRCIVTLLPDREIATVEAWLADHPEIMVVSRDRGGGYGEAAAKALPQAVQVADRWHLMENASAAFLDAVRKSMRSIRSIIGATAINPDLLTCAERLQYQGYLRREELNTAIVQLAGKGIPIKEIVLRTGHSRKLVRQVVRGERTDVFRVRQSSLEVHLPFHGRKAGMDLAIFAAADLVDRRAHVIVDPAPRDAAQNPGGVVVGIIKQHLVRLQRIGPHDEGAAVAELEVRYLQLGAFATENCPVFRPVELEGPHRA